MSQEYTLEIENLIQGKSLVVDVQSIVFSQFRHLSAETVGGTKKTAEIVNEITISRIFDDNSHLFAHPTQRSFPKAIIRIKSSGIGKSYVYTLGKLYLDSYIFNSYYGELSENIKFIFNEFSMKEESPVGDTSRPNRVKSSDKKQAAMMNFVKG